MRVVSNFSGWGVAALAGVAGAVAAGTVPDVIKGWWGEHRLFLTVLCLGAAGVFAAINLWQQRSRGVGIVVALPREEWRVPWSEQWTHAAVDHARRNHDSCFAVRRVVPAEADAGRRRELRGDVLELAFELVSARLTEISEADPAAPVSLYVNAALPDAFELGAMFKFNVQRGIKGVAARREGSADGPMVAQRSESGRDAFFSAIWISGRLKEGLSPAESVRVEKLIRVVEEPEFERAPDGGAVALVVHLADNPKMVAQALRAAGEGCADTRGRVERCRDALVIDGGPGNIPESADEFELVVRRIYEAWRKWVTARPQYAELETRLFMAAPASVAFALGWIFGHSVRIIPHPYEKGGS